MKSRNIKASIDCDKLSERVMGMIDFILTDFFLFYSMVYTKLKCN